MLGMCPTHDQGALLSMTETAHQQEHVGREAKVPGQRLDARVGEAPLARHDGRDACRTPVDYRRPFVYYLNMYNT